MGIGLNKAQTRYIDIAINILGAEDLYPTRILIEIPIIDILNIDKVLSIIWAGKTSWKKIEKKWISNVEYLSKSNEK